MERSYQICCEGRFSDARQELLELLGVQTLDHKILYLDSQLQKIYMQNKTQRCFCFQDQNWRFIKKQKKNYCISSHFDLILLFFAEKLAINASPVLFEKPKMQHFLMIYLDLMKINYEGTKKLCQYKHCLKSRLLWKLILFLNTCCQQKFSATGYLDIVL
jgi:hypothetical protein